VFELRPPGIPVGATALHDEETGIIVGYVHENMGIYRYYDLNGELVGMDEKGLETPLFDPIDLLLIVGGLFGSGIRAGPRLIVGGLRGATVVVRAGVLGVLRASFRRITIDSLKFTAKTVLRMESRDRHVPLHILHLAIKYGRRSADPQGVAGAFQYLIPMVRNGTQRTLKVVLREADKTILHFHFF
jgi:hypothetical protein